MKYSNLVQFEPIITVKVLREADDLNQAREDVRTFVISARMAEQLRDVIIPNLQIASPRDNKGLLTVANYGTGKTHLMSVISAVAEHTELAESIASAEARQAFAQVAGKFRVIRAEIGATEMSLRDIVCTELERGLKKLGVTFAFPSAATVTNTKDSLVDMMDAFEAVHPGRGLLFVLDELLDYLRRRRDAELIQDLAFLREVGEICRSTRFRFIAGIQEAIFENPRFAGVADAVQRVKARFEQVRISREDVAYVVKQRLLKKSTEQRDVIRAHLQPFTPLYEGMAENFDEFVELFPVHPAYIRTFERISAVEKREILKTLSEEMRRILDSDVPSGEPGLLCYDSYRARLVEDPSNRQIPEVREVLDKSEVLRNRVEKGMATKQYVATARRIIDALAVHRLTTEDIYVPIGATRQELRDDLCLLPPNLPERDAFFLGVTVDAVLAEVVKAVSGQFISENPDNGQVYLDVRKDIDYDQKIEDRAASLDDNRLDEAYFKALEEVLERRDAPYVAGYRIWEYEVLWADRNVNRFGYLFMGAPNERSTAQPPRDFYIYFLQPYDCPRFTDEQEADEVFFRLERPAEEFTSALRRYAGATALAIESTATHRSVYESKARTALQTMVTWLRAHMGEAITVTYAGTAKPLAQWLARITGPRSSVKEQLDSIASLALAAHFAARYPGYPRFGVTVTRENLQETVRQALQQIATGRSTSLGTRALEALGLVDAESHLTDTSQFAVALLAKLQEAGGRATNRSDLLVERDPRVWTWQPWNLEPAWLVVVAAALTQLGRMEIGFASGQVDALGLDRLTRMTLDELVAFSHIAPPKALPIVELREIVRLLGLPPGLIPSEGANEIAVQQILTKTSEHLSRIAEVRAKLRTGVTLWGATAVEQAEERDRRIEGLQKVLENVKARNSIGKMNKLDLGTAQLEKARTGLAELDWVSAAVKAREHLSEPVEYLREAVEVFGSEHQLSKDAAELRDGILAVFRTTAQPDANRVAQLKNEAEALRRRFADEAARAHARDRLDGTGDDRKRRLLESDAYRDLSQLTAVSILPDGAFGSLQNQLTSIVTCKTFDESALQASVICQECGYRPRQSAVPTARATVDSIAGRLDQLLTEWERTLLDNLSVPEMQDQIRLLAASERTAINGFLSAKSLPAPITPEFVRALNQVFGRFEVRNVNQNEIWSTLFPESTPTTPSELRGRFEKFLAGQIGAIQPDKVRFIPVTEESRNV